VSYQVQRGLYGNTATVTATASTGQTVTASDPAYLRGTDTLLVVQKAINAADPLHPTPAEDANDAANPRLLPNDTNVIWTYLLTNPGTSSLTVTSFRDDAGTPGVLGDDFTPKYVSGDDNHNNKLDPARPGCTPRQASSVTTCRPASTATSPPPPPPVRPG